jgi:hypothetical protein
VNFRRNLIWFGLWGMAGIGAVMEPAGRVQAAPIQEQPTPEPLVRFNRDIRPILSAKCFACHGPDAKHREAGLRLDTAGGLLGESESGGDSSNIIAPADIDNSELFQRVSTTDSDLVMPPPDTGKQITPSERELLRRWIEQGATFEGHWAFEPITPPTTTTAEPTLSTPNLSQQIDQVLDQAYSQLRLEPTAPAEPHVLIRRLSQDLLGLPPAIADVERFRETPTMAVYEQLVDQYLASPHFGERMAVWWLDLVRYADSVGYHGDQSISVSPYRDYVIRAFNENMPFDRFTVEQLAGDLLPQPTREQLIASGYNRLGMMSAEGGVQDKEYLAKYIAERVRNASGTWLGLTVGCAECHDHKFDPISTKEFYQFAAFFADIEERGLYSGANDTGEWGPTMPVPTAMQAAEQQRLSDEIAAINAKLTQMTPELITARTNWETGVRDWRALLPTGLVAESGTTLTARPDQSILASGSTAAEDRYELRFAEVPAGARALRLEVLPDASLPQQGPGRAGNGNFVLSEIRARIVRADESTADANTADANTADAAAGKFLTFASAAATFEQTDSPGKNPYGKWAVAAAIDDDRQGRPWGWAIAGQTGQAQEAVFVLAEPLHLQPGEYLEVVLEQRHTNPQHVLGCFRLAAALPSNQEPTPLSPTLRAIVDLNADQRTAEQQQALDTYFRSITPLLAEPRAQLAEREKQLRELAKSITTTPITRTTTPRTIRVLGRGNWMDESGEVVAPSFPVALGLSPSPTDQRRLTRLDLAQWLVDSQNPLTARVLVNRVWKLFFGAGLSRKLDDMGSQGEWPAHLELLDLLAHDLRSQGWDLRRLIKGIVMSAAYRRDSAPSETLNQLDPENRWFARQNRFRLDAEFVRDQALAVSGLLVREIGGRSVYPWQPAGYWAHLNFPMREWQASVGQDRYRRGLYTHWQRQYLHPSLIAFDAPNREECTADRPRSNTPLQALVLLNDPNFVEAARVWGELIMRRPTSDREQAFRGAWAEATARPPTAAELQVLENLWQQHVAEYRQDPAAAKSLLTIAGQPLPADLDQAELAAWTSVARVILNLHETVTRY